MCLFKALCSVILLLPVVSALALNESQTDRNTEAQRYYDLAVSYIKSDLYVKGLETLNQVAFLYPDSNVADDALYQLALIREQVGDGKIKIGEKRSIDTVNEELARLEKNNVGGIGGMLGSIVAYEKGQRVVNEHKLQALTQYILALDYLNTLAQRYSDSDRIEDTQNAVNRIIKKIRTIYPKQKAEKQSYLLKPLQGCLIITCVAGVMLLLAYITEDIMR